MGAVVEREKRSKVLYKGTDSTSGADAGAPLVPVGEGTESHLKLPMRQQQGLIERRR
jgi:hypothetical protein